MGHLSVLHGYRGAHIHTYKDVRRVQWHETVCVKFCWKFRTKDKLAVVRQSFGGLQWLVRHLMRSKEAWGRIAGHYIYRCVGKNLLGQRLPEPRRYRSANL